MSSSDLALEASTLLIDPSHRGKREWTSASFTPRNETEFWLLHMLLKPTEQYMDAPVFMKREDAIEKDAIEEESPSDCSDGVMRYRLVDRKMLDREVSDWIQMRYYAIVNCFGIQLPEDQEDWLLGFTLYGERYRGYAEAFIGAFVDPDDLQKLVKIDPYKDLLKPAKPPREYTLFAEFRNRLRRCQRRSRGWVKPAVCNA